MFDNIPILRDLFRDHLVDKVVHSLIRHKMGGSAPRYVPSFKSAIHFFCIHAGGRAVLDGIEKNLRLTEEDMQRIQNSGMGIGGGLDKGDEESTARTCVCSGGGAEHSSIEKS